MLHPFNGKWLNIAIKREQRAECVLVKVIDLGLPFIFDKFHSLNFNIAGD